MSLLSKLVPLVILLIVLGIVAVVLFVAYSIATEVSGNAAKKMERKNVVFTKDGMKVGVKEVHREKYADQTQKYVLFSLTQRPLRRRFFNKAGRFGFGLESCAMEINES